MVQESTDLQSIRGGSTSVNEEGKKTIGHSRNSHREACSYLVCLSNC